LQALPYAVEEQLLTDVNELHFAIGDYQADGTLPVAIVAKTKIAHWVALLKAAGIEPSALIPAPLTLPLADNDWFIQLWDNQAIVRTGTYSGFACDKQNLLSLLTFKQTEQTAPHAIYLLNTDAAPLRAEKEGLTAVIDKQLTDKQFYAEILPQLATPAINLLQGEFQARRKTSHSKKIWLLASCVTAAWLAIVLFGNIVSYAILHHEASKLQTAINRIYMRNFPQATSVVAPKQRITDKLNNLLNQNHKNRLLVWLASIGKSLHDSSAIKIKQLDYRNNVLNLEITAPNFDSVDHFAQSLTQQNLQVKQQNFAAAGTQVKGVLIITDGGQS
jgi:general secretion pathway protein L